MTRINHAGHIVTAPIVPECYFNFLLERDRRLKEIMQMFEVGTPPMFIRCHEVLERFEKFEYFIFLITDSLEDYQLRDCLRFISDHTSFAEVPEDAMKKLSERDKTKHLFYRLLEGLAYWHYRGKAHTDIRPENILIKENENGCARFQWLNFGLSKLLTEDDYYGKVDMSDYLTYPIGTVEYKSSENRTDENYSDVKADIFALGVTLFEFLYCARPFKSWMDTCRRYRDSPHT